jgi:hypothetical protein
MVSLLFGDSGDMRLIVRRSHPALQAPIKARCNVELAPPRQYLHMQHLAVNGTCAGV